IKTMPLFQDKKIWVLWKKEVRDGKPTKVPYQPNGRKADSTAPCTWSSCDEVISVQKKYSGIGFVIAPELSLLAVDLDGCVKEKKHTAFVKEAATYTEISPSGNGLHVIFHLSAPLKLQKNKSAKQGVELYTKDRYFTYTGNVVKNYKTIRTLSPSDAEALLKKHFNYPWKKSSAKTGAAREECPEITSPAPASVLSDDEVLSRMFSSRNGAKIRALWDGNKSAHANDDSAADAALCAHLAFWTQKNKSQITSLWLKSPLGNREKTQKRKDYRERTI